MDIGAVRSELSVGVIVGFTGVGGGSPMTPLPIAVFKLHPAMAGGTGLCFAAITKPGGTVAHQRHRQIDARTTGHGAAPKVIH